MLKITRLQKALDKSERRRIKNLLEYEAHHKYQMELLNHNWCIKFDMLAGIFQETLEKAGTVREARKWFREWTNQLDAIDDSEDAPEQIADLIERNNFEFEITPVDVSAEEMLNTGNRHGK